MPFVQQILPDQRQFDIIAHAPAEARAEFFISRHDRSNAVDGPQRQIETVAIAPDDNIESRRQEIIDAVRQVDSGDGVAILTDMFGGTPSNLAISVMNAPNVEVVAGINLPMLVKLASVRGEKPLSEAVTCAQEAGRKYINVASEALGG